MSLMIEKCPIEGLLLIQPKVFKDPRGYFLETWNEREYKAAGLTIHFIQDNQSKSKRGVLRGLHFQSKYPQGKLVRVILGEVFDVAVDLREGSSTFGKWYGVILSGEKQNQLYIPPGFAHGFLVLSDEAVFAYRCTEYYHPEDESGIRWDDCKINIEWPDIGQKPLLSAKDMLLPSFDATRKYFNADGGPL